MPGADAAESRVRTRGDGSLGQTPPIGGVRIGHTVAYREQVR